MVGYLLDRPRIHKMRPRKAQQRVSDTGPSADWRQESLLGAERGWISSQASIDKPC